MTNRRFIIIFTLALLLVSGIASAEKMRLESVQPEFHHAAYQLLGQHEAGQITTRPSLGLMFDYAQPGTDPAMLRWNLIEALLPNGEYCMTRNDYQNNIEHFVSYDDANWTAWTEWIGEDDQTVIELPELDIHDEHGERIAYLLAVQVMASDGSVSSGLEYGQQVVNFIVTQTLAPYLTISHPLLGTWTGSGQHMSGSLDLLPGEQHGFMIFAQAHSYGSLLEGVRWGWDIADPDDPNDPGWGVPMGQEPENFAVPGFNFNSGIHVLTVHALDAAGYETRCNLMITMVPMPDPGDQMPLLLVDDVRDSQSNSWGGAPPHSLPLDRDEYRDAFWNAALSGAGGVADFDPAHDQLDAEDVEIRLRDVVNYRLVLWEGRYAAYPNSAMSRLRPTDGHGAPDHLGYHWLGAYQQNGGNVLHAGSRAVTNTLAEAPYLLPVIMDSPEGDIYSGYDVLPLDIRARVGFGNDEFGPQYERLYAYRDLGVAAVDVASPAAAYFAPNGYTMSSMRRRTCNGLKGVVLDPDFVASHMGGTAAFADTIWTESTIDWEDDPMPADGDVLDHPYRWGDDEFYDVDVVGRDIPVVPQDCDGEACLVPLWRSVSRYDWVQQQRQEVDPEDNWPIGYYDDPGQTSLDEYCGQLGLMPDRSDAPTNNQTTAFVTRKHLAAKPGGAGDVVLGFDPYRFDHEQMTQAIQWILGEHFGLAMTSKSP